MASEEITSKQQVNKCLVCGDIARGINFDVMTCMSCKAFFRRNAIRDNKEFRCEWENKCEIDQRTRSFCTACRLKKCFQLGMNANLIRTTIPRTNSQSKSTNNEVVQPTTITQLSIDRSVLNFDEWNTLSNILQAYDEQNMQMKTFLTYREQSTALPPKIRWKFSNIFEYLTQFYEIIRDFLQRIPQFANLKIDSKRLLIRKNFNGVVVFNSLFLVNQFKLFDNEYFLLKCKEVYGHDLMEKIRNSVTKMDSNETIIKLLVVTLAFSSNCSLVEYNQTADLRDYQSTISIHTQDIFIILIWKYLVYQYGFHESVRRLNKLVKFYLDILTRLSEIRNQERYDMVQRIIDKILRELQTEK